MPLPPLELPPLSSVPVPEPFSVFSVSSMSPESPLVTRFSTLPSSSRQVIWIEVFFSSSFRSTLGVKMIRRTVIRLVFINSGYRSEEVNRLCGGAKGSNHLTGCAVDIRCYGPEHMIRMARILLDIADETKREFDELILEKRGSTYWVHFAVRPSDNRRKILFDCH